MRPSYGSYLLVAAVATLVTFAMVPLVRKLAYRFDAVVKPDERRGHDRPTPPPGGLALLIGGAAGFGVASLLPGFDSVFANSTVMIGIAVSCLVMYGIGAIDDLREMSAPAKLAGTILAASILVLSGTGIVVFRVPFQGIFFLSVDWSFFITVLWVIAMTTAVNLIDGLDGLAAGIMAIAAGGFWLYADRLMSAEVVFAGNPGPLVAVLVIGMAVGFLPHNFHPAKIFMGDGGALLLGVCMAASTVSVGGTTDVNFSGNAFFFFAPMLIPLVILGVPFFDTAFAFVRRATRRTGIATPDKDHLHHRLMRSGHGHRRSVLVLWGWTALLSGFVLFPTITGSGDAIVPGGIALLALALMLYTTLTPGIRARREAAEEEPASLDADSEALRNGPLK